MISADKVKRLFLAYRDYDDLAFLRTAQSIIEESLATNQISEAKELKKALGDGPRPLTSKSTDQLSLIPNSSRGDGKLLALQESEIGPSQIVFTTEAKEKINRIIEEHKNNQMLHAHGLKAKSKLLFWGPPGCGKTFTSLYLAHELGLPIAVVQISSLISSYFGDTATHIKKIFDYVNSRPVILLLDEFDAIGKTRSDNQDVGEIRRTVNSLLQALDTITSDRSIIIAASNYQNILDEALWRRFDDIIEFPKPSKTDRQSFLKLLLRDIEFSGSLTEASAQTKDLSFAEIQKVIVETVKTALICGNSKVTASSFHEHLLKYQKDIKQARKSNSRNK